jgi:hypothetical protein
LQAEETAGNNHRIRYSLLLLRNTDERKTQQNRFQESFSVEILSIEEREATRQRPSTLPTGQFKAPTNAEPEMTAETESRVRPPTPAVGKGEAFVWAREEEKSRPSFESWHDVN